MEYSHDGEFLAAAGIDGVFVWDVTTGEQRLAVPASEVLVGFAFSRNGTTLYTTSEHALAEWDLADRRVVDVVNEPDGEFFAERVQAAALIEWTSALWGAPDTPAPDGAAVVYPAVTGSRHPRILDVARHELLEAGSFEGSATQSRGARPTSTPWPSPASAGRCW